jgi:WD40 repeat protein
LVFSPDGSRLAAATSHGSVKVWDVSLETRSPSEVGRLSGCAPWRIEEGRLVPAQPSSQDCAEIAP